MAAGQRVCSSGRWAEFGPHGRPGPRGPLLQALVAVWLISVAETLDVTIFTSPKKALLNTDVSLECKFTGFGTATLSLTDVGVQWLFGPQKQEIYVINAGRPVSRRPGTKMSETELQKGDASLHLSNVQLDDEGEYTCVVFVTPASAVKSSQLLVLAQPVVHLSTQHITIQNGTEKSVRCDATGFYPQQHEIIWKKISKEKSERVIKDICTELPVYNNDGTFNVSSRMRLEPTLDDDGTMYRCVMKHQSLPDERSIELELRVKEPEKSSPAGVVIGVICVAILLWILSAMGWFAYQRYKKVPPEITGCSECLILKHLEEEIVTWEVSPFRPCEITIQLYLKRKEDEKRSEIFNWSSKDSNKDITVSMNGGDCIETQILINSVLRDPSFQPLDPEFKTDAQKTSSVKINVKIYPDVSTDDGAELTIEVQHKALMHPITKTLTVHVKGVPPKVLNILAPPSINHNESVALTCTINGFKPRPLSIIWQQKRKNNDLEEIVRLDRDNRTIIPSGKRKKSKTKHYIEELEHEDKTYSITSMLVIVPDIQKDQDMQYFCKIQHHCTDNNQEREILLKVAAAPKLHTIKCEAEKAIAEVPMTLSCQIYAFYPKEITVTWLKNGEKMVEESKVDEPVIEQDGLYHLTSNVKIVPARTNSMLKYTCQVAHVSLAEPIEIDWVAGEVISLPKLTVIEADPSFPEMGMPLTLSCKAYGFYPEGNQISWFKGFDKIEDASKAGIKIGKSEMDLDSGLYSQSSQCTFKPSANDQGREFKMEFLHSETSSKPVTSSYILQLKGTPYVEDITSEPQIAEYGTELVLSCKVNSFTPKEINTMWSKKGKIISTGVKVKGPEVDKNGCFQLSSCLRVKPTALDFGESYSFEVKHSKLNKPITKQAFLTLPALPPVLSDIKSDSELLNINQNAKLSISLAHYVPAKIQVKWFKDGKVCQQVYESTPEISDDGLFSSVTSITFLTTKNDHKSSIKCEVIHEETKQTREKDFILLLKDFAEKEDDARRVNDEDDLQVISSIRCHTESPKAGQPVTLSCNVKGYTIDDVHILWYRDTYPFDEREFITNTPFETGRGFNTALTYSPSKEHTNHIQVFVEIDLEEHSKFFNLILS